MQESRSEPVWSVSRISMLTLGEISLDDLPEVRIEEEPSGEPIEERGKAVDRCHRNQPAPSDNTQCLPQSLLAVVMVGQVVHGSEQENDIDAIVRQVELSGIANLCRHASSSKVDSDSLNMTWRQVNDVNIVAILGEPRRVNARPAPNVQHSCRRWWQVTPKDLLGSHQLKLAEP